MLAHTVQGESEIPSVVDQGCGSTLHTVRLQYVTKPHRGRDLAAKKQSPTVPEQWYSPRVSQGCGRVVFLGRLRRWGSGQDTGRILEKVSLAVNTRRSLAVSFAATAKPRGPGYLLTGSWKVETGRRLVCWVKSLSHSYRAQLSTAARRAPRTDHRCSLEH